MIRRGIGVQSYVSAGVVPPDADATAFITAAGITDATQQSAINTLVTDLKGYGIWTKMKAIYPFVGGTASAHKFNLKDPRDLDAAFRLVFSGGWTHSSTGALPGGINGYGDTKLNLSSQFNLYNVHYSIYCRTNNQVGIDIGVTTSPAFAREGWLLLRDTSNLIQGGFYDNDNITNGAIRVSNTDSKGFYVSSAIASNNIFLRKNNSQIGAFTGTNTSLPGNGNIYIGAINNATTSTAIAYANREYSLISIGDGLTDTEAANLYTAVQAYQTTLSRQVS